MHLWVTITETAIAFSEPRMLIQVDTIDFY